MPKVHERIRSLTTWHNGYSLPLALQSGDTSDSFEILVKLLKKPSCCCNSRRILSAWLYFEAEVWNVKWSNTQIAGLNRVYIYIDIGQARFLCHNDSFWIWPFGILPVLFETKHQPPVAAPGDIGVSYNWTCCPGSPMLAAFAMIFTELASIMTPNRCNLNLISLAGGEIAKQPNPSKKNPSMPYQTTY